MKAMINLLTEFEKLTKTRALPLKEQLNSLRLRLKHGIVTNSAAKQELAVIAHSRMQPCYFLH
jgi:hypothetical protein